MTSPATDPGKPEQARAIDQIDWSSWKAKDPATLVFVIQGDQILLIRKKRGLGAGKINGPGGKLDPGESPEVCAIRECQEELHITPKNLEYCGQNLFQFTDGYAIHVWVYRTDAYEGNPTETDEAIPLWFNVKDIPYAQMWEDDYLWLPLALDRKQFVGRFIFDGETMVDHVIEMKDEQGHPA